MRQWQSVKIKCLRVCGWDWRLGWLLGCWPGGIRFLLRWNDNSLKGYYFLNPNPNLSRSCIDDRPNDQPPSLHLIQLHESNVISILFCLIFYWTNNDRVEFDNIMIALHVSPIPTLLPSALLWITAAFSALCWGYHLIPSMPLITRRQSAYLHYSHESWVERTAQLNWGGGAVIIMNKFQCGSHLLSQYFVYYFYVLNYYCITQKQQKKEEKKIKNIRKI